MKKMSKYLSFVLFFILLVSSARAFDKQITFKESSYLQDYDITSFYNAGTTYKTAILDNKSDVIAYSFNHQLNPPPAGAKVYYRDLTSNEKRKINSYIYILNNGWNGKSWKRSGSFTDSEKYYITQLTIWGLQGTDGGGIDINKLNAINARQILIKKAAISFLKDAKANSKQQPVRISMSPTSSELKLSADKKYYVTSTFKVRGSGYSNYNVQLSGAPKGTQIYVPSSSTLFTNQATVSVGKDFYIRIPTANITNNVSFTVNVFANGKQQTLIVYQYPSKEYQDIGVPVTETKSVADKATIKSAITGSLSVRKVLVNTTGEEEDLNDVNITVTDSNGVIVAKWNTTDINPKKINNLLLGIYTIHEVNSKKGYTKSEEVNVVVKANETVEVKLQDPKDFKPIYISKQDATTGASLPGAKLVLKDSLGTIIEEWTSDTSPHLVSKQLIPGRYTLTESIAPDGYQLSTKPVSFLVNIDGSVDNKIIMKSKPVTSVKISEIDANTSKELPGAKLIVKNENDEIIDEWISTTIPHYLPENLKSGIYMLIEQNSPHGYGLNKEVIEFEVTNTGIEQTFVMKKSPISITSNISTTLGIIGSVIVLSFIIFRIIKVFKKNYRVKVND